MTNQVDDLKSFSQYLEIEERQETKSTGFDVDAPATKPEPDMPTSEVVGAMLGVTFSIIAARKGEHWNLSPEEIEATGDAYGALLDKYFPDSIGNLGIELTAVMVTGMLIVPRLAQNKKLPTADDIQKKAAVPNGFQGVTNIHEDSDNGS